MNDNTDKSNVGYTLYKPTGVHHEYPHVDLVKQQVTCAVTYKGKTYMTVMDLSQIFGHKKVNLY